MSKDVPSLREIELTIRARIKDIDRKVELLRAEQVGLEKALSITLGESELVEDKVCDPLGRAILMVNNDPQSAFQKSGGGKRRR